MALIDIPQYRSELAEIRKSLLAAGDALHIDHIREQLDELTEEMNQPEFWNDPDHSAKVNQKVSNLKGKLEHYENCFLPPMISRSCSKWRKKRRTKTPSPKR